MRVNARIYLRASARIKKEHPMDKMMDKMMDKNRSFRDSFRRLLVLHRVFDFASRPCGVSLSLSHAHALLELFCASKELTITELSKNLQIDRTNVSRLCQQMEESGELERLPNPTDRRAKTLRLTEKGKALAEHIDQSSAKHFGRITEHLGDDAEGVFDAIHKLNRVIQKISENEKGEQK